MKKANTVTINCDMGEGYSLYRCGDDAGIMPHIDLGNVACGFHAADPAVIRDTVKLAAKHGLPVGAHPSFPDRQGFGRRDMVINREELSAIIHYQVSALKGFLDMAGLPLNHIKPHGALYRAAWMREEVSQAIADAAVFYNVPVLGMAGTLQEEVYRARGVTLISEFYVDNDYDDDGHLIVSRDHAVRDPAEAARRAVRMLSEGKGTTITGRDFKVRAESICLHSDTPNIVELARVLKEAVRPWSPSAAA